MFYVEITDKATNEVTWRASADTKNDANETAKLATELMERNGNMKNYEVRVFESGEGSPNI